MNIIFPTNKRAALHLPFSQGPMPRPVQARAAVLSTSELKQIVAAMLGWTCIYRQPDRLAVFPTT